MAAWRQGTDVRAGDVIEFESKTRLDRLTAEVLLVAGGRVVLDLLDDANPVIGRLDDLDGLIVFEPERTARARLTDVTAAGTRSPRP